MSFVVILSGRTGLVTDSFKENVLECGFELGDGGDGSFRVSTDEGGISVIAANGPDDLAMIEPDGTRPFMLFSLEALQIDAAEGLREKGLHGVITPKTAPEDLAFLLNRAKGRDMPLVTQADTVDAYLPLREDLILTSHAAYELELLDRFTYEDETENSALFRLLTDTLSRLASRADPWLVIRYYEIRLLDHLGFRPQLFECVNCGREIKPEDQYFSFSAGGAICPRCGQGLPNVHKISVEALRYLRHFQRSSYADATRARPDLDVQRETETLMQGYFTYLLERELNTPGFLKKIRS